MLAWPKPLLSLLTANCLPLLFGMNSVNCWGTISNGGLYGVVNGVRVLRIVLANRPWSAPRHLDVCRRHTFASTITPATSRRHWLATVAVRGCQDTGYGCVSPKNQSSACSKTDAPGAARRFGIAISTIAQKHMLRNEHCTRVFDGINVLSRPRRSSEACVSQLTGIVALGLDDRPPLHLHPRFRPPVLHLRRRSASRHPLRRRSARHETSCGPFAGKKGAEKRFYPPRRSEYACYRLLLFVKIMRFDTISTSNLTLHKAFHSSLLACSHTAAAPSSQPCTCTPTCKPLHTAMPSAVACAMSLQSPISLVNVLPAYARCASCLCHPLNSH